MKLKIHILLLMIVVSLSLCAQQDYEILSLGIERGLTNNYILSIAQDKDGFMWFATESGLNRFDGQHFKSYKKSRTALPGLSGNELRKLYADTHEPFLWIATQKDGLNRLNLHTGEFTIFKHNPKDNNSIIKNDITDIVNDSNGNLWISTFWGGVDYYDKKQNCFSHYNTNTLKNLASDMVWTIANDKNEYLYIGHVNYGLSIISLKTRLVKHFLHNQTDPYSLPGNDVRSILIDGSNNIWIGTNNGLALFDFKKEKFININMSPSPKSSMPFNRVYSIQQMSDKRIWVGTEDNGIYILDIHNDIVTSSNDVVIHTILQSSYSNGLTKGTVTSLFEDSYHNIWIGTYGGGINFIGHEPLFFHKWQYSPYFKKNALATKEVWGICEDNKGNIWIGTDGGGINVFQNGICAKIYNTENSILQGNAILAAYRDSQGNLWFGTYEDGISVFNTQTMKWEIFSSRGFKSKDIRCFFEDKNQKLFIGTNDNGMYSFDLNSKELKHYTSSNSGIPSDNLVRAICKDSEGQLWVGSFGQGVNVLDTKFQLVRSYNIACGLYSNVINYIFQDSRKRMWIATGEGLVKLNNVNDSQFSIYTEKNGLADSHIKAITEDRYGHIWFSTNSGISKYSVNENKFYNYNCFDGVAQGDFKDGSVINGQNGYIYFGSQNGLTYFNPQAIDLANEKRPVATITGFYNYDNKEILSKISNDSFLSGPDIQLKYNQNTFTISFGSLDYATANKIEYAYKLEGISDKWYYLGNKNEVTFQNLQHGKYIFLVKAKLKNQDWSNSSASLQITITPPLWLTPWVKSVYVIVLLLIIYQIVRFYKNRLQLKNMLYLEKQKNEQQIQLNEERMLFYTNITHELRTPLSLIIGPLEDISNESELLPKIHKKIQLIYQNSVRLMNLVDKILDFRKTETNNVNLRVSRNNISQLVLEMGLKYKELNRNSKVKIVTTIETECVNLYYDSDIIYTIIDNLLSNSLKYTTEGEIRLTLRTVEDRFKDINYTEIEIRDTGCGISKESLPNIYERYYRVKNDSNIPGSGIGLSIVKNLVQLHQAEISVESTIGEGTTFKLRLITNNIYPHSSQLVLSQFEDNNFASSKTEAKIEGNSLNKSLLIVEDNVDIANYIADSFSEQFTIYRANNGEEGLAMVSANMPDVIISDIMMPKLSGLELCNILKKDIKTSHIPIVLLTAKNSLQDKTIGYSVGADSYITKPFSSSLLKSRIKNLMEAQENHKRHINLNSIAKQKQFNDSVNKLDKEFLDKIVKLIKDNCYSEKIDIEFITQNINMSHSVLYRKVKNITNMTVNEFIRKIKIEYAKELLLTNKYTISEVAYHVGFNSLNYFRQCFKEEYGVLPSEFLNRS